MTGPTTTSDDEEVPTSVEPSDFWSVVRCIAAMVLVYWIAMWLFSQIAPDFSNKTLEVKYDFLREPQPTPEFHGIAQFLISIFSMLLFCGLLCLPSPLIGVAVVTIFAFPDASGDAEKREMAAAHESHFAARYNEFYCNTRTLQVCMEGDDPELLQLLVHGDLNATASSIFTAIDDGDASDNPTWFQCQALMRARIRALEARHKRLEFIVSDRMRAFLNASNLSDAGDRWCGKMLRRQITTGPLVVPPATAPHVLLLLKSPYSANKWMFAKEFHHGRRQRRLRGAETHVLTIAPRDAVHVAVAE